MQYTQNPFNENILFKDYSSEIDKNEIMKIKDTDWFKELKINYKTGISNTFILTGNIFDYVVSRHSLETYLTSKLTNDLNIKEICYMDFVSLNKIKDSKGFDARFNSALHLLKNDENEKRKALILKYPEYVMPNIQTSHLSQQEKERIVNLHSYIMDEDIKESRNIIIIILEKKSDLNNLFFTSSCRTTLLNINYPNLEERESMIRLLDSSCKYKLDLSDFKNYNELAHATCGLTRVNLEEIWRRGSIDKKITRELVKTFKQNVLQKEFGEYLDIHEPNENFTLESFGGMDYLKDFFRTGIIEPIRNNQKELIPNGLLFMGPPGTGKTYLSKCLASESCISFAELKIATLYSKWVGETESKLQKALDCIKSLAPVIVLVDEIDQVLIRGDETNSHIVGNLFQMMLSFMSDPSNRGNVIWIGATNYPDKVDEAVKRAGRFDIKVVFSPPINEQERKDIFKCHLKKLNYPTNVDVESKEFKQILDATVDYTQAEIEFIVSKAASLYIRKKVEYFDYDILLEALQYVKRRDSEEVNNMIKVAIDECNDLEFLSKEVYEKYSSSKCNSLENQITNDIFYK